MYISRNFLFDYLFFENQGKINIKNSEKAFVEVLVRVCFAALPRSIFCVPGWRGPTFERLEGWSWWAGDVGPAQGQYNTSS
jgi:hypothetical protein